MEWISLRETMSIERYDVCIVLSVGHEQQNRNVNILILIWTGRGKSGVWDSSIAIRSGLLDGFVRMAGSEAINLPIRTKLSVCLRHTGKMEMNFLSFL